VTDGSTNGRTILIVDDDEEIRHVLRMMCEIEGYHVVGEASHGVEAVQEALKHQPRFVILDYLMPHLDGEGTASLLRAVSPGARIVAFSAVLDEKPDWSDAYLNKERIQEVVPLLDRLIT
jgi:two-component system, chemotaxis family, chemotaxis protein CheY